MDAYITTAPIDPYPFQITPGLGYTAILIAIAIVVGITIVAWDLLCPPKRG